MGPRLLRGGGHDRADHPRRLGLDRPRAGRPRSDVGRDGPAIVDGAGPRREHRRGGSACATRPTEAIRRAGRSQLVRRDREGSKEDAHVRQQRAARRRLGPGRTSSRPSIRRCLRRPYVIGADGRRSCLPSQGGIVYNVRVGDSAFGWLADLVQPGVSIRARAEPANQALNVLSCLGNEAIVVCGEATGRARDGDRQERPLRRARDRPLRPGGARAAGDRGQGARPRLGREPRARPTTPTCS